MTKNITIPCTNERPCGLCAPCFRAIAPKNFHALTVKYFSPTIAQGSRIKITSPRFGQSVFIPFDHALNSPIDMATPFLIAKGFNIVGSADMGKGVDVILTDTFKPLKV